MTADETITANVKVLCKNCGKYHNVLRGNIDPYYICREDSNWGKYILLQTGDTIEYQEVKKGDRK